LSSLILLVKVTIASVSDNELWGGLSSLILLVKVVETIASIAVSGLWEGLSSLILLVKVECLLTDMHTCELDDQLRGNFPAHPVCYNNLCWFSGVSSCDLSQLLNLKGDYDDQLALTDEVCNLASILDHPFWLHLYPTNL